MPLYENYVTGKQEDISTAVDFYLVPISGDQFIFRAISQGINTLEADPFTFGENFIFLTHQQITANAALLFPNDVIRETPLTYAEVEQLFSATQVEQLQIRRFDHVYSNILRMENHPFELMDFIQNPNNHVLERRVALRKLNTNSEQLRSNDISVLMDLLLLSNDLLTRRYAAAVLEKTQLDGQKINELGEKIPALLSQLKTTPDSHTRASLITILGRLTLSINNMMYLKHTARLPEYLLKLQMRSDDVALQEAIAFTLTSLIREDASYMQAVIEGLIAPLDELIATANNEQVACCSLALASLVGHNPSFAQYIYVLGGTVALINQLEVKSDPHTRAYIAMALSLLAQQDGDNKKIIRTKEITAVLKQVEKEAQITPIKEAISRWLMRMEIEARQVSRPHQHFTTGGPTLNPYYLTGAESDYALDEHQFHKPI